MVDLTKHQERVLVALRGRGLSLAAGETEDRWREGRAYYLDTRINVPRSLRRAFEQGNQDAVQSRTVQESPSVAIVVHDARTDGDLFEVKDAAGIRHLVLGIWALTTTTPPTVIVEVAGLPKQMTAPGWEGQGILPFQNFYGQLIRVGPSASLTTISEAPSRSVAGRWAGLVKLSSQSRRPRPNAVDQVRFDFHAWCSEPPSGRLPHVNYRARGLTVEMVEQLIRSSE